jgi:hypothetical protein
MSLNLEVDRADGVQDGYIILNIMVQSSGILNTVWLQLQICNCGDSRATTAFLANYHEKFGGKMRLVQVWHNQNRTDHSDSN